MKDLLASVFRLFRKDDPQKPVQAWPFPTEEAIITAKSAAKKRVNTAKSAEKKPAKAAKPAVKTAKKAKK